MKDILHIGDIRSPASGGIRTHDLSVMRRELCRLATTIIDFDRVLFDLEHRVIIVVHQNGSSSEQRKTLKWMILPKSESIKIFWMNFDLGFRTFEILKTDSNLVGFFLPPSECPGVFNFFACSDPTKIQMCSS